jgi:putative pyruvate formate lyase activating enzyme
VNLVSPSHVVAQVPAAVEIAAGHGLALPIVWNTGGLAGTEKILEFLAREISPNTTLNLMDQYHLGYKADGIEPLSRPLRRSEWNDAVALARSAGLTRLDRRRESGL